MANAVNLGYTPQTMQAQSSVARQVSVALSFNQAVQHSWKFEVKFSEWGR